MSKVINMLDGINRLNLAKIDISVPETQKQNIQKQTNREIVLKNKKADH